ILEITLNRPRKYNALTKQVANELLVAFEMAATDDAIRCVLLTGAGKGFCSGQDLSEAQKRPVGFDFAGNLEATYNQVVRVMQNLPKPIVGAINGAAAGAGFGLALATDIRYLSDQAKFIPAFVGIGLGPDTGVSYWLPRLIGPARAAAILFANKRIGAEEAVAMGLANEVFPHDSHLAEARQFAQQLAAGATLAIGLTKQVLGQSLVSSFDEQLTHEAQNQQIVGHSADYREGTTAFREKRKPIFQGK
ncbi:MAG: enoyl-CoA hydratase-related protein, partial [Chloroflexota bacterium]